MVDADGRARDALGRHVPHRLSWITLARGVPGLLEQFRPVPVGYWHLEEGGAVVTCPCGHVPSVTVDSVRCKCGRIYLFAQTVYVANSPVRAAART